MEIDSAVRIFRRKRVSDPYTHGAPATVPDSWEGADSWVLEGAWVDQVSVVQNDSAAGRVGSVAVSTLYVEAGLRIPDVQKGDGVARGERATAPEFVVELVPFTPDNPFTGYRPLLEVPLRGAVG